MQKGSRNVPRSQASKTTLHYWKNKKSREHHSDSNNSGSSKGKFAHTNAYKNKHANARANDLKIKPNQDMVTGPDGKLRRGNRKHNRGLGRYE
mgnify:CR=1 FL=1